MSKPLKTEDELRKFFETLNIQSHFGALYEGYRLGSEENKPVQLEPWENSKLADVIYKVSTHHYRRTSQFGGIDEDITFLLKVIEKLLNNPAKADTKKR